MAGSVLARHALALWVAGMGRGMGVYIYIYVYALRGLVRVDASAVFSLGVYIYALRGLVRVDC